MTSLVLSSCLVLAWPDPPPQGPKAPAPSPVDVVAAIETAIADAIAKAEPSVVAIHRYKGENSQETQAVRGRKRLSNLHEPQQRFPFEGRIPRIPQQSNLISFDFGSGVVIGDRGQILTMYHVVKGARQLIVRAAERQEFDAEIIAADPRSDLAVIAPTESDGAGPPRLRPLPIGDAGRLRKGAFLIALGNSFNAARDGKPSASWGILSNIARKLDPDLDDMSIGRRPVRLLNYPTLLQLDTKLNLGMSGGAVINLKGELVGLTTMAASPAGFDAVAGYAIPMDTLGRRAVETLKEGKEIEYGLLGIRADPNYTNRVGEVTVNSPAALGQLQAGDEIIAINDAPVFDFDSLILAVNVHSAGDSVRLKIRRGDETIDRTLVLAKFPIDGELIATNRPKPWRGLRVDYTSALNLLTFGPNFLDSPLPGVVVVEVEEGSPAASAGIKKGQLIRRVGDRNVRTPRDFAQAVATLDGPVTLQTDLGPVTIK
jgi:S1-C subfamily serine protease